MSLVNEMLNELQKEQQKSAKFDGLIATDANSNRFFGSTLWLLLLSIATLMTILWWFVSQTDLKDQAVNIQATSTKVSQTNAVATPEIKPAEAEKHLSKPVSTNATIPENKLSLNQNQISVKNTIQTTIKPINLKANKQIPEKFRVESTLNKDAVKNTKKATPAIAEFQEKANKVEVDTNQKIKPVAKVDRAKKLDKTMIKVSRKSLAEKRLQTISNSWGLRSFGQNKQLLENYLQEYSDIDTAWLGSINLVKDKNFTYFEPLLEQALAKFPAQPAFRMILVKQHIEQNNFAEALLELKKIESENWQSNEYKIAGYLAQKINDHISAIRFYNHLLKSKPNQGDVNMAIAISLEALNENDLAVAKFQRALEDSSLKPIQRQFITQRIAVLKG